jgi:hypothetical protein
LKKNAGIGEDAPVLLLSWLCRRGLYARGQVAIKFFLCT